MTYPTKAWLILCLVILYSCGVWFSGAHTTDKKWQAKEVDRKLSEATSANAAWAERFTLQAQLATRDQQLAEAQLAASNARTETIIKREVIYLERTKDPVVRDCVANSGLLDVYDATLGLSSSAE